MRRLGPILLIAVNACGQEGDRPLATPTTDPSCRFTATTTLAGARDVEGAAGYQVLANGLRLQLEAPGFLAVFGSTAVTTPEAGTFTVQVGSLVWSPEPGPGLVAAADTRRPDARLGSLQLTAVEGDLVRGDVEMELTAKTGERITVTAAFEALPGHAADTGSAFSACLARLVTPS